MNNLKNIEHYILEVQGIASRLMALYIKKIDHDTGVSDQTFILRVGLSHARLMHIPKEGLLAPRCLCDCHAGHQGRPKWMESDRVQ